METEQIEGLEEAKAALLDANSQLMRLRQEANRIREETKAEQKKIKDLLTDLAERDLIEWDSAYRRRQNT